MERLQKHLASLGVASRRKIESWIEAGRISVDGETAWLGMQVDGSEQVRIDGRTLQKSSHAPVRVLLLNKRAGIVCTRSDPEGRRTCFEGLPTLKSGRWVSVGRLDINTSGLLLLTNQGELANRMMHPSTGLDREYAVRLDIRLSEAQQARLLAGVDIGEEALAKFSDLRFFRGGPSNYWYHLVLMEGRKRQIRRMFEALGARVSRLKRVRFGPVILPPGLLAGHHRALSPDDTLELFRILAMPKPRVWRPAKTAHQPASRQDRVSALIPYPELENP